MIAEYNYGNMRFMEYTNSMYYMLSKSGNKKDELRQILLPEMRKSFHQSPMTTKNEIKTFINRLNGDRKVLTKLQTEFDIKSTSEIKISQYTNTTIIPLSKNKKVNFLVTLIRQSIISQLMNQFLRIYTLEQKIQLFHYQE